MPPDPSSDTISYGPALARSDAGRKRQTRVQQFDGGRREEGMFLTVVFEE